METLDTHERQELEELRQMRDRLIQAGLLDPRTPSEIEEAFQRRNAEIVRRTELNQPPVLHFFLSPEAQAAGIEAPRRAYVDDAGFDLRLLADAPLVLRPHERKAIPTGVGFQIPSGWYGLICNRTSGGRRGLLPLGHVVDASFTGFLTLTLLNTTDSEEIVLEPRERVAQIVFMPTWVLPVTQIEPDQVKKTDRGAGKYGSSGRH